MMYINKQFIWVLAGALSLGALPGCEDPEPVDGEEDLLPADFYLTVKLATNFRPKAIDQLEVVMHDTTMLLVDDLDGQHYQGEVRWETREGDRGDEFVVTLSGSFFQSNAMEVSEDVFEIDIPFIVPDSWERDPPEPSSFSVAASAYWEDLDGFLQQIGRGTGQLVLPPESRNPTTIEVECWPADMAWTCRTGCDANVNQCVESVDECCEGSVGECDPADWDCVDECCVPL